MQDEEIRCVYCGSTHDLEPAPELEEIWICARCWEKRQEHQSAIDYGYDDEDPKL